MQRSWLTVLGLLLTAAVWWFLQQPLPQGIQDEIESAPTTTPPAPVLQGAPASPPPDAPPQGEQVASGKPATIQISGRVVDDKRFPIAGATVVVAFDDNETGRATTADDGSFLVSAGPRRTATRFGTLHAYKDTRAFRGLVWVTSDSPAIRSYPPIVLTATHSLTVRVVHAGKPVPGADVVLRDAEATHLAPGGPQTTAGDGRAHWQGVTSKKVRVHAVAPGLGRGTIEATLPTSGEVEVELPPDREVVVTVIESTTKEPIADAQVYVEGGHTRAFPWGRGCLPPLPELRTDSSGVVRVAGLPAGILAVMARTPGWASPSNGRAPTSTLVQADAHQAVVELKPYRTVTFPITASRAGAPEDGTALELVRFQPIVGFDETNASARVMAGQVQITDFPPGHDWGQVIAPDGRWAQWRNKPKSNVGDPVQFHPSRDVRVHLRWRDGTPAARQWIRLQITPRGRRAALRTNDEGVVRFEACRGKQAYIRWAPLEAGQGRPVGTVDLLSDPDTTEITIDRPVDLAVRIEIDGVPGLPPAYTLSVAGANPTDTWQIARTEIEEDPTQSELRVRCLSLEDGTVPPVTVTVEGYPPATGSLTKDGSGIWRGTVRIQSSTTVTVQVNKPEGSRYYLWVERWHPDEEKFVYLHNDPAIHAGQRGDDGVHRYVGLAPGRYRITEGVTKTSLEPFELTSGGAPIELTLDLSEQIVVKGRVVAPDGALLAFSKVRWTSSGQVEQRPLHVDAEGRFQHPTMRGTPIRYEVTHPVLRAASERILVNAGERPPVLHLEHADRLTFRIEGVTYTTPVPDPRIETFGGDGLPGAVRVRIAPEGQWSADAPVALPLGEDGHFELAIPKPGTYALRIEIPGRVPRYVPRVEAKAGVTDLGVLLMPEGATLTVRLIRGKASLPEYIHVSARLLGDAPYTAGGYGGSALGAKDPARVTLKGLGTGRFHLEVKHGHTQKLLFEREIESDGTTPLSLDVALK